MPKRKAKQPARDWKPLLAACADPHIGNHARFGGPRVAGLNDRGHMTLATFGRAVRAAVDAGCNTLAVCGDLFHTASPSPREVSEVQRILDAAGDLGVVLVPGNHDMPDATAEEGNTACEPLWPQATVVRKPQWFWAGDVAILAVPFDARKTMTEHLTDVLGGYAIENRERRDAKVHVLVTHVGVYGDKDPPWMSKARDGINVQTLAKIMDEAAIDLALVGNFHNHADWTVNHQRVVQIGTLCPARFSDEGTNNRGLMALTDGKRVDFEEIPGPRFIDVTPKELSKMGKPPEGYHYFVRQVGGDPPQMSPADKDWSCLDYKPAKVLAKGNEQETKAAAAVLTPEKAIQDAAAKHATAEAYEGADKEIADRAVHLWRKAQ